MLGPDPKKIFSPQRILTLGILVVGKGGGKDWLIAIVLSYVVTVLLHLKNPQKFLLLDGNLDILNVATKGKQADDIFFSYFIHRIKQNRWLFENFKIYDSGKALNKVKDPIDIIEFGKSSFIARKKRIRCFSETTNNESWEGYNVIFFVLDEISGFMSESQASNGWKIYNTARTSCISRSTANFKGFGFVISYPRQEQNDIILDLYRMSQLPENTHMYGMFSFAWNFKPVIQGNQNAEHIYYDEQAKEWKHKTFEFSSKRLNRIFQIPEEEADATINVPLSYQAAFNEDPEGSLTMFCCLPPRQAGDWIEYPDKILAAIDKDQPRLFKIDTYERTEIVDGEEHIYISKRIDMCLEKSHDMRWKYSYVAWLDAAEVHCDAVIAIARKETIIEIDERGQEVRKDVARIVEIIPWIPEPGKSIDLVNVEQFLTVEIKKYINLKEVGSDRWESASLANKLIKAGIKSIRYNLKGDHYNAAKRQFYTGCVKVFDEEPFVNRHIKELTSLEQILALKNSARGPEKKPELKKDKSDAVVGCINLLLGNLFTEKTRPRSQKMHTLPKIVDLSGRRKQDSNVGVYPRANVTIDVDSIFPAGEKKLPKLRR